MTTRRGFLKALGTGAVTLAVGGTGILSWRAVAQGVFASGKGPAYDAWRSWMLRPASQLDLVRAAVLAASAHNTQPWAFRLTPDAVDLIAVPGRNIGAMDPLRRELEISLGCALENLMLAARAWGRSASLTLLPGAGNRTLVARVALTAGEQEDSPLYRAIPLRHTNRGAYDVARPVAASVLQTISGLVDVPGLDVVWWTSATDKQAFGDLTVRATQAIVADPRQSADDYRWYRGQWTDVQSRKDGITLDAAGLSPVVRSIAKVLPQSPDTYRSGWIRSTRAVHVATAAAFGGIVSRQAGDVGLRVQAGRLWQRIHLWATNGGLAVQPLNQALERSEWERAGGFEPLISNALLRLMPGPGLSLLLAFRIGYPTAPALASPRRPAEDVIVSS